MAPLIVSEASCAKATERSAGSFLEGVGIGTPGLKIEADGFNVFAKAQSIDSKINAITSGLVRIQSRISTE
jgi:hypothetical protein